MNLSDLVFDDDKHKFSVMANSPRFGLQFGPKMFFTTLTNDIPVDMIEQGFSAGQSAFNNDKVFPALSFLAEAIAIVPRGSNPVVGEVAIRNEFEFGFVQGTRFPSLYLEYWGKTKDEGRRFATFLMPNGFEVDTNPDIQPWTRAAGERAKITNVTADPKGPLRFKISADFTDHPMVMLPHTFGQSPRRFLRSIRFTRDFRTVFCAFHKASRKFSAISATAWRITYNHVVSYSGNGAQQSVENFAGPPHYPRGGTPSNVEQADRDLLEMAEAGQPLVTMATLNDRLTHGIVEDGPNPDWVDTFWAS